MSSEWPRIEIGQVAKLRSGFPFKSADWKDSGVPVIKIANVKGGRIIPDGCGFVSTEVAAKSAEWYTRTGDVLIAMTGYVGEVAQAKSGERYLINQRVGRFDFTPNAEVEPTYLFYHLQHPDTRAEIEGVARGSAQPNLSAGDAHKIKITLPPLVVQRQIAATLGALDDRITLLRETNTTLEAIAQALFKSWFVDFDPVRAKMEGRAPEGMDEATAALFPDAFEETELGMVPRGWSVQPIGDLVEAVGGSTPDTKNETFWSPALHHWTSPKDLSGATAPVLLYTERKVSEAGLAKITSGLLPVGTLLMSSRAPIGYLSLSQIPVAINQGYIAMLPGGRLPPTYLYFWCQQNMDAIKGRANGSTFMEISKKAFRPIPAIEPSTAVVRAFVDVADILFSRLVENEKQAQTLATQRDTLLPRLISGQLRLPETEQQVEESLT